MQFPCFGYRDQLGMAVLRAITDEARGSWAKFGPYQSTHEAFGVLAEEVAELLEAIRQNNIGAVRVESIQVAAVALKLAVDCGVSDFRKRSGA
ncbi:MAG: hypothetical protein OES09_05535 [Gammaproteobacteria bacterium]|nr:hypothetical protein [Gammaproteobacteria bacterium]